MSSMGKAIAALRSEQHLTQQELAQRAGVSLEWVRGVEQGRVQNPRMPFVIRVADVLGVDPIGLASGDMERPEASASPTLSADQIQSINASLATMQKLSRRRLSEVQRMIEFFAALDEDEFQRGDGKG